MRNFNKRTEKEYNWFRTFFTILVYKYVLGAFYKLFYKFEITGVENIVKNRCIIIAPNHMSSFDPFIVAYALDTPIAFMSKKELFEKFFPRLLLNLTGAFAVNREKLEISTIKTAMAIKKTKWPLGIFPQGTREKSGAVSVVQKGFAALAKAMKTNILPVAVLNTDKKPSFFNKPTIIIKIGKEIPYSDDVNLTSSQWVSSIIEMTGFENKVKES